MAVGARYRLSLQLNGNFPAKTRYSNRHGGPVRSGRLRIVLLLLPEKRREMFVMNLARRLPQFQKDYRPQDQRESNAAQAAESATSGSLLHLLIVVCELSAVSAQLKLQKFDARIGLRECGADVHGLDPANVVQRVEVRRGLHLGSPIYPRDSPVDLAAELFIEAVASCLVPFVGIGRSEPEGVDTPRRLPLQPKHDLILAPGADVQTSQLAEVHVAIGDAVMRARTIDIVQLAAEAADEVPPIMPVLGKDFQLDGGAIPLGVLQSDQGLSGASVFIGFEFEDMQ